MTNRVATDAQICKEITVQKTEGTEPVHFEKGRYRRSFYLVWMQIIFSPVVLKVEFEIKIPLLTIATAVICFTLLRIFFQKSKTQS